MLECLDPGESREVRDFFGGAGYTTAALQNRFHSLEIPALHVLKLYYSGVPLGESPLDLLIRWFWIGLPVDAAVAAGCLPRRILDLLLKAGLLCEQEARFTPAVRLSPFADFLVASDHAIRGTGSLIGDTILWPNPTTLLGYHMSMRSPVARALDIGTGSGILALHAAQFSREVVATDLNPRARDFCRFNAGFNQLPNIEFRQGSAFEPVAGERFDLILANPPFFVTPSLRRMFSDNSMELDGFCRMLIHQAPEHLNEGGYCQMLLEWTELENQPWPDRLKEWIGGIGCDASILALYSRSAAEYAMLRVYEDHEELSLQAQAAQTIEWQAYFREKQVKAIYGGIVILRRRAGDNWLRIEELHALPTRPFGDAVRRMFDNRDALEQCAMDDDLLRAHPALPSGAKLHTHSAVSAGVWRPTSVELDSGDGLGHTLPLQPAVADFVALCDGVQTLGEQAASLAARLHADPAVVRRECCTVVRQLAERNLIRFPDSKPV